MFEVLYLCLTSIVCLCITAFLFACFYLMFNITLFSSIVLLLRLFVNTLRGANTPSTLISKYVNYNNFNLKPREKYVFFLRINCVYPNKYGPIVFCITAVRNRTFLWTMKEERKFLLNVLALLKVQYSW